jgi:hypothetical protein
MSRRCCAICAFSVATSASRFATRRSMSFAPLSPRCRAAPKSDRTRVVRHCRWADVDLYLIHPAGGLTVAIHDSGDETIRTSKRGKQANPFAEPTAVERRRAWGRLFIIVGSIGILAAGLMGFAAWDSFLGATGTLLGEPVAGTPTWAKLEAVAIVGMVPGLLGFLVVAAGVWMTTDER